MRGSRNGVSARRLHYPAPQGLRDLEAEVLGIVCNDVEVELVLQEVTGETLNHGANKAPDARLDIPGRGF